jgi:uncharacterized protein YcfJ
LRGKTMSPRDQIISAFHELYGRYPTEEEIRAVMAKAAETNLLRDTSPLTGAALGALLGGPIGAAAGALLGKKTYDTARSLPLVGDVLGVLEDIF